MASMPRRSGATTPARRVLFVAMVATVFVSLCLLSGSAEAASRVCRQLESELASAGGRSSPQLAKLEAAIADQNAQLQIARRKARGSGCGFKIFGGSGNSCRGINANIDRMEQNLANLEHRRAKAAGTGGAGRPRSRIMADLRANGCREDVASVERPARGLEGGRYLLEKLFGGGIRHRNSVEDLGIPSAPRDEDRNVRRVPPPSGSWINDGGRIRYSAPPGRYRTLCVRSCDGYFFPISTSSTPSDFERDQANCQSSCPGAEVQIYYTRPGQEPDTMVSGLSGQPYANLPTANLYRQTGMPSPAGCSCNAPGNIAGRTSEPSNYSVIAGTPPQPAPVIEPEPVLPQPTARPDPAADPETLANLNGGLDAEGLKRMAVTPKVSKSRPSGEERKVRVVGPVFLPAPEAAEDQQAPARMEVR